MVVSFKLPVMWDKDYEAKTREILEFQLIDFDGTKQEFMCAMLAASNGAVNPCLALGVYKENRLDD